MKKYFMGIDNGGTMCKAVIFDSYGKELGAAAVKLELETEIPGHTERDMEYLWSSNVKVIKTAIENAKENINIKNSDIKGIACAGHGKGLYLWGKDNKPCAKGIVSTDTRAWKYPKLWEETGIADKVFKKTYQKILACQPVSLLSWIKEHHPEIIDKIKWIFGVKDYIRYKLTSEAYYEKTDFSGSNMLNLKTGKADKELLDLFELGFTYDLLPPVKDSTDLCGYITEEVESLTGLLAGTPVAGGMFDIDACAIAMDITSVENICVIAGTWSINEYISLEPVLDKSVMMNSLYCFGGYYLIEECSPTSASNLEWFIESFLREEKKKADDLGINIYQYCNDLVSSTNIEDQSLIFLPYLFGSNYNPQAKACFIGLDKNHSSKHMARAVFEGITFCHLVHIEKLLKKNQVTKAIRLAGGLSKSDVWGQMLSDVTGVPVEIIAAEELGALGSVMAATVAVGEYKDLKEAAKHMVHISKTLKPNQESYNLYQKKFLKYKKASELLDTFWK